MVLPRLLAISFKGLYPFTLGHAAMLVGAFLFAACTAPDTRVPATAPASLTLLPEPTATVTPAPTHTPASTLTATPAPTLIPTIAVTTIFDCSSVERIPLDSPAAKAIGQDLIKSFSEQEHLEGVEIERVWAIDRLGEYVAVGAALNKSEGAVFFMKESPKGYQIVGNFSGQASSRRAILEYLFSAMPEAPVTFFGCIDFRGFLGDAPEQELDLSRAYDCSVVERIPPDSPEAKTIGEAVRARWERTLRLFEVYLIEVRAIDRVGQYLAVQVRIMVNSRLEPWHLFIVEEIPEGYEIRANWTGTAPGRYGVLDGLYVQAPWLPPELLACLDLTKFLHPTSTLIPTPFPTLDPSLPHFLYIYQNALIEQDTNGARSVLAQLPESGQARDALQIGDEVFVWREQGIQRVRLSDGTSELAVQFEKPSLFGQLMAASNRRALLYSNVVESSCSATGFGGIVGQYRIDSGTSRTIFSSQRNIHMLGQATDGRTLYVHPVGCDPSFGEIWQVSMETGETVATLPARDEAAHTYGYGSASLSPNARYLIFTATHAAKANGLDYLEYRLGFYDLAAQTPPLLWLDLPNPHSHIYSALWSPDSRGWYCSLRAGSDLNQTAGESYGLWRLDVQSLTFSRVADVPEPTIHLVTLTPDGQWLILLSEQMDHITVLNPQTGATFSTPLPADGEVIVVRH